jgi:uncharacterized protein (TIGR00369 family)
MTTTPAEIWEQRVEPPRPDPSLLALSGVEQLRAWLRRPGAKPPLARLVGMELTEVHDDGVVFTLQPSGWLAGSKATIHPGMLTWLADSPLAMATQTALPPGMMQTTAELSLTFLGRVHVDDGLLTAAARLVGTRGRDLLSEVRVSAGRLVAHGTSRCTSIPMPVPEGLEPAEDAPYEGSEPWQRPVVGEVLSREVVAAHSGLDLLRGQVAGALPLPPVHHLTGIRPVAAEEGTAVFALPTGPWSHTHAGTVYGGAIAFLASSAVGGAAQTLAPDAGSCDALDLKVNFLRRALPDGRALTARGTVLHAGKSLVVTRADVVDADGRLVALATGSTRLG